MAQAKERAALPNLQGFRLENANRDYAYKGSELVRPLEAFDDGVKTWFRFDPARDTPAFFIVDKDRNESLVNFRREGPFLVVDKVSAQWTLRAAEEVTCLFNLKLSSEEPGLAAATQPQRIGFDPPQPQ